MRLAGLLVVFIFFFSFALSASSELVRYSDVTIDSHACDVNSVKCAYVNSILVDSSYLSNCSSGFRILGLSDATNAHAETYLTNNYSTSICMKTDIISAGTCYYSSTCNGADDCLFGLSSQTNAHLSKCNVFGVSEVKFCCKKGVVPNPVVIPSIPTSGCNLFFLDAKDIKYGSNTSVSFACRNPEDVNIYLFTEKGDLLLGADTNSALRNIPCSASGVNFAIVLPLPQTGSNIFMLRVVSKECAKDVFFKATKENTSTTIPDANPIIAVLVCFMVVAMIFTSRKVNK
ncbi:MAG: hypothetical protein WC746_01290 [archaeon]|jgi:hypothetical protein